WLAPTHEAVRQRKKAEEAAREERAAILAMLRVKHPDLAEQVEAATMAVDEAKRLAAERGERLRTLRYSATMRLIQGTGLLHAPATQEHLERTRQLIEPSLDAQHDQKITPALLREVGKFTLALADVLEQQP